MANLNRFGPHSVGVVEAIEQMRQLTTEQWRVVLEARVDPSLAEVKAQVIPLANGGPVSRRDAVDKLQNAALYRDPIVRERIIAVDEHALLAFRRSVGDALGAIANRDIFPDDVFAVATIGYDMVGIDCKALAQLGEFNDAGE